MHSPDNEEALKVFYGVGTFSQSNGKPLKGVKQKRDIDSV